MFLPSMSKRRRNKGRTRLIKSITENPRLQKTRNPRHRGFPCRRRERMVAGPKGHRYPKRSRRKASHQCLRTSQCPKTPRAERNSYAWTKTPLFGKEANKTGACAGILFDPLPAKQFGKFKVAFYVTKEFASLSVIGCQGKQPASNGFFAVASFRNAPKILYLAAEHRPDWPI